MSLEAQSLGNFVSVSWRKLKLEDVEVSLDRALDFLSKQSARGLACFVGVCRSYFGARLSWEYPRRELYLMFHLLTLSRVS